MRFGSVKRWMSALVGAGLLVTLAQGPVAAVGSAPASWTASGARSASVGPGRYQHQPVARQVANAPDDHTLKVVSKRTYRHDVGSDIDVFADLKNRTKAWRHKVKGVVVFYNKSGKRIYRGVGHTEQLYAAPKGHLAFHYYWTTVPKGYDHYKLRFTSKRLKHKLRPAAHMKISVGRVARDPDLGGLNVPVVVKNKNHKKVRNVAVYVTLFDKHNKIVNAFEGYNYTRPSTLKPRKRGRFTAYFGSRFDGVRRVNVMVEAKIKR